MVKAFDLGDRTDHETPGRFGTGEATVHRWKRQHRETGRLELLFQKSENPPRVTLEPSDLVREIVREKADRAIEKVAQEFQEAGGEELELFRDVPHPAQAWPQAREESLCTTEQAHQPMRELRRRFIEDSRRLVFLVESGSRIAMTRDPARAPRGDRAPGSVPRNSGTVTTTIGALHLERMRAMMTIERATDAEVFETFVELVLARKLRPLDNLGA